MKTEQPKPKTVLKVVCMHCKKDMGEKDGQGAEGITTSTCRECWEERYPEWIYPPDEELENKQ